MNIGIVGYFNYGSFGDDLMLKIWQQLFDEHNVFPINNQTNIDNVDKIIIGGGYILERYSYNNMFWDFKYLQCPTYVYGIGVSDAYDVDFNAIKKYNWYLNQCKYISFRNTYDLEYFNCKYDLVDDIVWNFKFNNTKKVKTKTIGISLRNYDYNIDIIDLCKNILEMGYNLNIIQLYIGDAMVNQCLYQTLNNSNVKYITYEKGNEDIIISNINNLDLYITQKLHGFIIAMLQKTPAIIIGKINKFKYITERLNMQNCLVNFYNFPFNNYLNKEYNFNIINEINKKLIMNLKNLKN
jgi:polysaccharide pyruvyl transferase WcaK-like protein